MCISYQYYIWNPIDNYIFNPNEYLVQLLFQDYVKVVLVSSSYLSDDVWEYIMYYIYVIMYVLNFHDDFFIIG